MEYLLLIISSGMANASYLLLVILFLYLIASQIRKNKTITLPFSVGLLLITLFSFTYTIIKALKGNFSFIYITPIIAYLCGHLLSKNSKNDIKKIRYIRAIAAGFFTHALLNLITNIGNQNRNIVDIWGGESFSATLQGTFIVMSTCSYFAIILGAKKHTIIKQTIIMAICVMFTLQIGTRTTIIISIVTNLIIILKYLIEERKRLTSKIKLLVILTIAITIGYSLYALNFANIKTHINNSNLYQRIIYMDTENSNSDHARAEAQLLGLKSIIEKPLGNNDKIGNLKYAHNMWLDVGKEVGIIPFIILIMFSIYSIYQLHRYNKNKKTTINNKLYVTSIFIGMTLNMISEPIIQGVPLFFIMFVLILGLIDYNNKCDTQNNIVLLTGEKNNEHNKTEN